MWSCEYHQNGWYTYRKAQSPKKDFEGSIIDHLDLQIDGDGSKSDWVMLNHPKSESVMDMEFSGQFSLNFSNSRSHMTSIPLLLSNFACYRLRSLHPGQDKTKTDCI